MHSYLDGAFATHVRFCCIVFMSLVISSKPVFVSDVSKNVRYEVTVSAHTYGKGIYCNGILQLNGTEDNNSKCSAVELVLVICALAFMSLQVKLSLILSQLFLKTFFLLFVHTFRRVHKRKNLYFAFTMPAVSFIFGVFL